MVPKFSHQSASYLTACADKQLAPGSHSNVETSKKFIAVICAFTWHWMLPVRDHVATGAYDDDPRPGGQHSLH